MGKTAMQKKGGAKKFSWTKEEIADSISKNGDLETIIKLNKYDSKTMAKIAERELFHLWAFECICWMLYACDECWVLNESFKLCFACGSNSLRYPPHDKKLHLDSCPFFQISQNDAKEHQCCNTALTWIELVKYNKLPKPRAVQIFI
jgi:hypothetical protein